MQESKWNYCRLIQDPGSGKVLMLHLVDNQWSVAHEVKQLIDLTPEKEMVVS